MKQWSVKHFKSPFYLSGSGMLPADGQTHPVVREDVIQVNASSTLEQNHCKDVGNGNA